MTEWDEDPLLEIGKVDQNLWLYKAQRERERLGEWSLYPCWSWSPSNENRGGDGMTLTWALAYLGAGTAVYGFMRLLERLEK